MQVPKEASRYHQEEFSFKGGSTLAPLESINFEPFSNLEDEISFKGGSL
jgi:hypothetical protein